MENKKKKIIIIAIAVIAVIGVAAAVYFAMNKNDNEYVDVPVTEVVTNEMGEAVTDAQGQPVTEAVTDASGNPQTTKQQGSNNQNTTAGNNNQGGNSNNGSDSDSQQTTERLEDKKPKSRKITITAILPQGCSMDDVMEIWIGGEKDSEITVGDYIESNNKVVVTTKESYKDEVTVEVLLKDYKTNAKGTLLNNYEEIKFDFPLNQVEGFTGEDD